MKITKCRAMIIFAALISVLLFVHHKIAVQKYESEYTVIPILEEMQDSMRSTLTRNDTLRYNQFAESVEIINKHILRETSK